MRWHLFALRARASFLTPPPLQSGTTRALKKKCTGRNAHILSLMHHTEPYTQTHNNTASCRTPPLLPACQHTPPESISPGVIINGGRGRGPAPGPPPVEPRATVSVRCRERLWPALREQAAAAAAAVLARRRHRSGIVVGLQPAQVRGRLALGLSLLHLGLSLWEVYFYWTL
jgi:hypothetical protein